MANCIEKFKTRIIYLRKNILQNMNHRRDELKKDPEGRARESWGASWDAAGGSGCHNFKNGHNETKHNNCAIKKHLIPYCTSNDDSNFDCSSDGCRNCNTKYQALLKLREECRIVLDHPSDEIKEQNKFFVNFYDQSPSGMHKSGTHSIRCVGEKPLVHSSATDSFFLKIPLTSQKIFRTIAYNKFTMDLIKKSINNFTISLRREQDFALIKIEYSNISHVLEALKSTIRGDIFYLISKNMNEDDLGQFNRCTYYDTSNNYYDAINRCSKNGMFGDSSNIPTFFVSSDSIVINGNANEISLFESNKICKKGPAPRTSISEILFNFEYRKFSMMEILCKENLSKILVDNACEITCFGGPSNTFIVKVCSDRLENVKACKRSLNDLYYTNVLISWNDSTASAFCNKRAYFDNIIFIRESTGRCSAFGNIENIQKSLKIDETLTESNFLVDFEMGDFICGKKFGKTMKISKSTDCTLDVEIIKKETLLEPEAQALNDSSDSSEVFYKFKMQGRGTETLNCYKFLFDEFPVELCFDLDRKYHKKIIGMKGSTIQKIMKKYNIYAKFMSAKETFSSGFSGNVILKTPRKNYENLKKSQDEILSMTQETNPCMKSYAAMNCLKNGKISLVNAEEEGHKECCYDRMSSKEYYCDGVNHSEYYIKYPNIEDLINQKNNLF